MLAAFVVLLRLLTTGKVLPSVSDDVEVRALVQNCALRLKVYPEKRLPRTGNWGTVLRIAVRDANTKTLIFDTSNVATSSSGEALIDLCAADLVLENKAYDYYITAESHLQKYFAAIPFDNATGYVDLTTGGRVLLAGDTNTAKDNEVNSLDISRQQVTFWGNDSRNDLNKDGKVNSLDMANVDDNFYLIGD